mgnify:CR=1 FL=1
MDVGGRVVSCESDHLCELTKRTSRFVSWVSCTNHHGVENGKPLFSTQASREKIPKVL